ncbi:hypothetical protein AAHC03_022974 [Spirometra sp. Aus1]
MALTGHNSIIVFGCGVNGQLYEVERYDPDTANSEDLGRMDERVFAACVGVGDNVYVIGGRLWNEQGYETDQVNKFNVRTRRWTPCSPLAYPRCSTATCGVEINFLGDGTQKENGIIICGGQKRNGDSTEIVELFIPRHNRMCRLPSMQASRMAGAAVALPDGRVFVAGGCDTRCAGYQAGVEFCNLQSGWQMDSSSEFWQPAAPMTHARTDLAMAYFKGQVIAAGGRPGGNTVEVFFLPDVDHPLGQWTLVTPMSTLSSCSALLVCNNRLFAVGGYLSRNIEELVTGEDISSWKWTVKRRTTYVDSFSGAASVLLQ